MIKRVAVSNKGKVPVPDILNNSVQYQIATLSPFHSYANILVKNAYGNQFMNFEYCNGYTYTIKKGDTLYEISRSHKVPLSLLLRSNPFVDVFNLQVGDTLCIPTRQTPQKPCEVWGNCDDDSEKPEMPEKPAMPGNSGTPEAPRPPQKPDGDMEWERHVVKPGDTIGKLLDGNMAYLEAFGKKNGWDNVYLLPGVAYYVPDED